MAVLCVGLSSSSLAEAAPEEPREYLGPADAGLPPAAVEHDEAATLEPRTSSPDAPPEEAPVVEGPTPQTVFAVDPIIDTTVVGISLGIGFFVEGAIFSGELGAEQVSDPADILAIDRWVTERDDAVPGMALVSDLGLAVAGAYVIGDSLAVGLQQQPNQGWVRLFIYAEGFAVNWALANMTKLAVRRPRPAAYRRKRLGLDPEGTQNSLSFYSLHTSWTAGVAATASYFAFATDRPPWAKGVTVAGGIILTGAVATGRMLALEHFPTDVMAGAVVGAGVGLLVPHLHRVSRRQLAVLPMTDGRSLAGLSISGRL